VAFIEIPEMMVLQGKEAIELLNQMIKEFQQQKGTRLTELQADTLTKTATQMILMISGETQIRRARKPHNSSFLSFFRRPRVKRLLR
jgi:hypothetical protein